MPERPAGVALDQAEYVLGRGRKALDREIAVEEQGRDLCALQAVGDVAVGAAQHVDTALELGVDGLQLRIDRLQFRLRRLEFLGRGLQRLVYRGQLLVARFERRVG